jgi:hypothetical protein
MSAPRFFTSFTSNMTSHIAPATVSHRMVADVVHALNAPSHVARSTACAIAADKPAVSVRGCQVKAAPVVSACLQSRETGVAGLVLPQRPTARKAVGRAAG